MFVLDGDGVIIDKRFHENRMERDAPATLLEEALNIAAPPPGAPLEAISDVVSARAYFDSPAYQRWQRHQLTVELDIADGWHIYAAGTEAPYHGLRLDIESPDGVTGEAPTWPAAQPHSLDGLEEEHMVHTGSIRLAVPVTFGVERGTGTLEIAATVRFQACSSIECHVEASRIASPLTGTPSCPSHRPISGPAPCPWSPMGWVYTVPSMPSLLICPSVRARMSLPVSPGSMCESRMSWRRFELARHCLSPAGASVISQGRKPLV